MSKQKDVGVHSNYKCGSCPQSLETGNGIYCNNCKETYCRSCAAGGKSGIFGGIARIIGAYMTLGVTELLRRELLNCPDCKQRSTLIRV